MTYDHALVVPLMLAALIGYAASRLVCPEGVYHALARGFVEAEARCSTSDRRITARSPAATGRGS
ncbi:MAG: hypothetical protein NVSMB18_33290 [Acetobacteraceae bacterium]